jgi:ArsR family transcriptional regulator, arsenate/arsenite/antimonite-responsive transcriptional repressor
MAPPLITLEVVLKAFADRTRLRILGLLTQGEICVCDIHETLKIPQPKASRHLAALRKAGLVETRRQGLWVHYRLAELSDPRLAAVAGAVRQALVQLEPVQRDTTRLRERASACVPVPITFMRSTTAGAATRRRTSPN